MLSIWEGTTNVLSLDVLRCVARSSGQVLQAYFTHTKVSARARGGQPSHTVPMSYCRVPSGCSHALPPHPLLCPPGPQTLLEAASGVPALALAVTAVDSALSGLGVFVQAAANRPPSYLQLAARDLAYSLARIYMGT